MAVTACCIVQTTLDDEDKAEALASVLLEQKLAACIQIAPVQSRYLWRGVFMRKKSICCRSRRARRISTPSRRRSGRCIL